MENKRGIGFVTLLIVAFIVFVAIGAYWIYTSFIKPVQQITGEAIGQIKEGEIPEEIINISNLPLPVDPEISELAFQNHNTPEDCWIVYEGKVYDFTNADMHPNMAKTFYSHCGQLTGFEEAAKARHSGSSSERVENFGNYQGVLKS